MPATLRPLRADEYDAWCRHATDEYADGLATQGGTPPDVARVRAEKAMNDILSDGLATPGHAVFVVEDAGEPVGQLWIAEREIDGRRVLFIFDIEVDAAHRGRGYGRAAMLLAEDEARARGIGRIELNVFGGNAVARRLYLDLGYVERSIAMAKDLT